MNIDGAKCTSGHELEIVAEGYGLCSEAIDNDKTWWSPWRFTKPALNSPEQWGSWGVIGRDGTDIDAWVSPPYYSKADAMEAIERDIAYHRALPFDEDAERARLMPV